MNSPSAAVKSMPFNTRVSSGPSLNGFTKLRTSIISPIPPEDGVGGVLPHDHTRRQVPCDDRREDEESNTQHRPVDRRDEDAVAEGEIDGMRGDGRHENAVEDDETNRRADDGVEE